MATPSTPDQRLSVNAMIYSSGKYSDMTIICKGKTFKVHQCIVCLQSKPLAAAMDGKFKEGPSKEIDLEDDQPEIVEKMLSYMYTSDYSDGPDSTEPGSTPSKSVPSASSTAVSSSNPSPTSASLTNAQLFVIADKYDIQGLKELAKKKYEEVIADSWNSASFVASLKLLYEETLESDRALKDAAVKVAGQHAKELVDRGEFAALCIEHGQIGFDVLKSSISESLSTTQSRRCANCGAYTSLPSSIRNGTWYCYDCGCNNHF
ncbi:Arm repeat protein interacting with ABF2 [Lachnellula occidentalis]|uniref:Arm repeat protein interacting with ABF2 n=1 Tax=Lachnellula occidentalis TaxID=215460 RepID=A0A8H8UF12_9HELO|nr:Arm repeat protein interacting with ABF2 [Lachnellula occidentalis]